MRGAARFSWVSRLLLTLFMLFVLMSPPLINPERASAAPTAPTNLTAVYNSLTGRVNLTWVDTSPDEVGFHIETAINPDFTNSITFTTGPNVTTYSDFSVYAGDTFYYRVTSYDATGDSSFSNVASVFIPLFPPAIPVAPSNLSGTVISTTHVNLAWADNSVDETGFLLEKATNAAFTQNVSSFNLGPDSNGFSDDNLAAGNTYYYRLSAYNALGSSPYANVLVITTAIPVVPSGLTAVAASENQINLTWSDNSNNESSFRIERSLTSDFAAVTSVNLGANVKSYHDTPVLPDTTYYYRVIAVNVLGESLPSSTASVTTPSAPVIPADPAGFSSTLVTATRVDLEWTDNSNNETGFVIQRATDPDFTNDLISFEVGTNTISFSDTSVAPDATYYYRVYAVNGVGNSGFTNVVTVTTPALVPAAPSGLNATIIGANQVDLSWLDNAGNETGFRVERADDAAFTTGVVPFDIPAANTTSYSDTSTVIDTIYYYRVFAYNISGDSLPSNVIAVATHITAPNAPSGLNGTLGNPNRIDLTWTDNSPNETGFRLDTALDPAFTLGRVIITLPANTTIYSDLSVYRGETFYYRILAFNSLGESQTSPVFSLVIPPGTPSVINGPTNLSATAVHGNRVDLSFTDNTEYEVGFLLERALDDLFTVNPDSFFVPLNDITGATVVFSDETTVPFTTYFYRVRAFNATGSSLESNIADVTTPDAVPAAPGSLSGTVDSAESITLTWMDASSNETGFRVERTIDPAFNTGITPFTVGADIITFTDASVVAGVTYYYRVYAFNTVGDSIEPSNTLIITAGVPEAPTGLSAVSVSPSQVDLTWTDNSDNENSFRIERATAADFSTGFVSFNSPAGSSSYSDVTVTGNTLYYYRVFAVNGAGDSPESNIASLTTIEDLPLAPTDLTATAFNAGQVDLAWTDNSSNESGFRIERATDAGFTVGFTAFTTVADIVSYSDITTSPETTYYYRVFATNVTGRSDPSNTASVTTPAADPALLPSAPTNLTADMINSNRIDLTWVDNSTNENGFRIYTSLDAAFSVGLVVITVPSGSTSYVDLSVYPDDTFYYRVVAYNNIGESDPSNIVSVTIPLTGVAAPLSPSGLTAVADISGQIELNWVDNSDNEIGFLLERAQDDQFTLFPTTFTIPSDTVSFIDETTEPARTYYYRLMAYNALGVSSPSNTATASTTEVLPLAPGALTARVINASQVDLSWSDNSNNETEFRVERSLTADFATVTPFTTAANVTTYSDVSTAPGTTYYYRVLAVNGIGDSAPSNVVMAVTPSATAPNSPSALAAVVVNANQVHLSWMDNAANETGFRVERAADAAFTQNTVSFDIPQVNAISYIDNTTVGNTVYFYRVYAYNASGDSASSNFVSVNTGVPAPPSNLRATLFSASRVDLAWNDNSNNETGFRIDRADDAAFSTNLVSFPAPQNAVSYNDTTVLSGNTYYYRVVAANSNGSSDASNVVAIAVTVPAAAGNLSAAIFGPGSIDLSWTDNSNNESGFQIDRATNSAFTAGFTSLFAPVNSTSYRDSGLISNITYYYRVIAYNAVGDGPASNVVNIVIAPPAAPTNLSAEAVSASGIDLSWTDNSTNETGLPLKGRLMIPLPAV